MIENKNDHQLGIKSATDIIIEKLSPKAKNILAKLDNHEKRIKDKWLYFKASNANEFDFRDNSSLKELFKQIYYRNIKTEDVERKQDEPVAVYNALEKYNPKKPDYVTARKNLLINAKKIYDGKEMIINAFKNGIFPLIDDDFPEDVDREVYHDELETIPEHPNFENEEEPPTDILELESEESAAQRRNQGQGIKILTPEQMFSRLPISLAQLKAGNNSENLKNEIRQLLYSWYRSKN